MLFNSFFFLLIFLPLSLAGWFGLNKLNMPRLAKVFLILMSFWFYGAFGTEYIPVLLASIVVNYGFSMLSDHIARKALQEVLQQRGQEQRHERIMAGAARKQHVLMFFGILFNLLFLVVFKYGNEILGALLQSGAGGLSGFGRLLSDAASTDGTSEGLQGLQIILPVGISFYTFSQISFLIDRCRGDIGHDSFLNYCLAMSFYPKLAEGPITLYQEIGPQFHDPERKFFRPDNFTRGLSLFIFGLGKKVLLADNLAPAADFGFSNTYYLDTLTVIMTVMAYMFQLYFDFSGYMDMGMGIAWMFNIELPLNFDSPFKAVTFSDFWQKWHMTLTRFFTRYIYIPLGGSRHGQLRTMLNVMIVFLLSALWHGSGWTYLYWGAISGLLVIICNSLYRRGAEGVRNKAGIHVLRLLTTIQFGFTLIFFRAGSIDEALAMLRRFFYPTWPGFLFREAATLELPELYIAQKAVSLYAPSWLNYFNLEALLLLLAICIVLVNGRRSAVEIAEGMADAATNMAMEGPDRAQGETPMHKRLAVGLGILLAWCMISMSGVTTYLYFQF